MSGASPWGTFDSADDDSSLIMSGATIRDKRTQVNLSTRKYNEDSSYEFTLTRSKEDDYSARGLGFSGEWDLNNKLSTISAGFSFSDDEIKPVDALKFGRIEKGKNKLGLSLLADPDYQSKLCFIHWHLTYEKRGCYPIPTN